MNYFDPYKSFTPKIGTLYTMCSSTDCMSRELNSMTSLRELIREKLTFNSSPEELDLRFSRTALTQTPIFLSLLCYIAECMMVIEILINTSSHTEKDTTSPPSYIHLINMRIDLLHFKATSFKVRILIFFLIIFNKL